MDKAQLTKNIEICLEAATQKGDVANEHLLKMLKDKISNRDFLLPFIGQFSAGKSKLINTLLGKDILPTNTNETTAILTYVKYSPREYAEVVYKDGTKKTISIDEVSEYFCSALGDEAHDISRMNVYVRSELLKSGLTIVDTPGLNSLIETHIELTEHLLHESQYVVLVMRSQLSPSELNIIEMLENLNIPVIYVRTHLDEVNLEEESYESVEAFEKSTLEETLDYKVDFFALTCENDLNEKEEWRNRLNKFKTFLIDNFVVNLEQIYLQSTSERVDLIAKELVSNLKERVLQLETSQGKDVEELRKEQRKIEKTLKELTGKLDDLYARHARNTKNLIEGFSGQIECEQESSVLRFRNKVLNLDSSNIEQYASGVSAQSEKSLIDASRELNALVENKIAETIRKYKVEVEQDIEWAQVTLQEAGVNVNLVFDLSQMAEYNEKIYALQQNAMQKLEEIQALRQLNNDELQELGLQRDELDSTIEQISDSCSKLNQALAEFDIRCPQRYVKVKSKLSQAMSKVGNALDIALLAIPSTVFSKGAALLAGKGASLAGKTGKLAQAGSKLLTAGAKPLELMAKTDTIKDIMTIGAKLPQLTQGSSENNALIPVGDPNATSNFTEALVQNAQQSMVPIEQEKKTSIFEKFTLSYMLGKVGEFLSPSKIEIDKEFEAKRECAKYKMNSALEDNRRALDLAHMKAEKTKDNMRTLERELKLLTIKETNIKNDYKRQEEQLIRQRDNEIRKKIKTEAIETFRTKVDKYSDVLKKRAQEELNSLMESIMHLIDLTLVSELDQKQEELEQIIDRRENHGQEDKAILDKYTSILNKLEAI